MKKSELRQIIKEEIHKLNESAIDYKAIDKAVKKYKKYADIETWLDEFLNDAKDYEGSMEYIADVVSQIHSGSLEKRWLDILGMF